MQVHWLYDHEVDPFDLGKICLLFCSDRLYTDRLIVSTIGHSEKRCLHVVFLSMNLHVGMSGINCSRGMPIPLRTLSSNQKFRNLLNTQQMLSFLQFLLDVVIWEPKPKHIAYKP